ncbi:MAG: hypothetical protein NVS3B12_30900 [Acidimicrobiales bacterium]
MHDTDSVRPSHACLTCPPPRTNAWRPADNGYRTCSGCYDSLRDYLAEIPARYAALNPQPGGGMEMGGRGAPGFGSRPPASLHVIAMRDPRSSAVARVWVGKDGRVHQESEQPVLSVLNVLDTEAWTIAEARNIVLAGDLDVPGLCRWLDSHLDWVTRQPTVVDLHTALRGLLGQLRPVTGEPGRRHIGLCPGQDGEDGGEVKPCGARLYAPLAGDEIRCGVCDNRWPRESWLQLGDLLAAS